MAVVPSRAPFTAATPPPTVAVPPVSHGVTSHPLGTCVPENSAPTVDPNWTSPSPACATTAHAPAVPAEKSAAVVSVVTNVGTVIAAGADEASGEVLLLPAGSADVTR